MSVGLPAFLRHVALEAQLRRYLQFLDSVGGPSGVSVFGTAADIATQRLLCCRFLAFVENTAFPFANDTRAGHVTGSALVVNDSFTHMCLLHHAKLGIWVQPGGHSDGNDRTAEVALREVAEETGLRSLSLVRPDFEGGARAPFPIDVDLHTFPARGDFPAHPHYDVRYLVVASAQTEAGSPHARDCGSEVDGLPALVRNAESRDLRWFPFAKVKELNPEDSVMRLVRKASVLAEAARLRGARFGSFPLG